MIYLKLDDETTEFVAETGKGEKRFPGTVKGAVELYQFLVRSKDTVYASSDLNHPNEFPYFEKFAIDIAAGELEDAIQAGVISVDDV